MSSAARSLRALRRHSGRKPEATQVDSPCRSETLGRALGLATSRSLAALVAQPSFPNGTGILGRLSLLDRAEAVSQNGPNSGASIGGGTTPSQAHRKPPSDGTTTSFGPIFRGFLPLPAEWSIFRGLRNSLHARGQSGPDDARASSPDFAGPAACRRHRFCRHAAAHRVIALATKGSRRSDPNAVAAHDRIRPAPSVGARLLDGLRIARVWDAPEFVAALHQERARRLRRAGCRFGVGVCRWPGPS
jgi:hypothetical protein